MEWVPTLLAEADGGLVGWSKILDYGTTATLVVVLAIVVGRTVLPKMLSQHEALITSLLESFRSEASKAREYHEKLVASHEQMFREERDHHQKLVQMIVDEWRQTRQQLHEDANRINSVLAALVGRDRENGQS